MEKRIESKVRQKFRNYSHFISDLMELAYDPKTVKRVMVLDAYRRWELEERVEWFSKFSQFSQLPDWPKKHKRHVILLEEWDKQLAELLVLDFEKGLVCLEQNRLTYDVFRKCSTYRFPDSLLFALDLSWRRALKNQKPKP